MSHGSSRAAWTGFAHVADADLVRPHRQTLHCPAEGERAARSLRRSVDEVGSQESEFALAPALTLALVSNRVRGRVHGWSGTHGDLARRVRW